MNFLIIEDDNFLGLKLKKAFEMQKSTNNVKLLSSYEDFLDEFFIVNIYDIVLVDINLGNSGKNGLDIIKMIRSKNENIPIIVISCSDDIGLIDLSFQLGANDYIVKPFRCEELQVRVSKWFRTYFFNIKNCNETKISYEGLDYNLLENEFYFNGEQIVLTKKNKYLLSIFLSNNEQFLSKDYLINKLWGDIDIIDERNIRVYIYRLKTILKDRGIDGWINNVRGEGYIFKK